MHKLGVDQNEIDQRNEFFDLSRNSNIHKSSNNIKIFTINFNTFLHINSTM